MTLVQQPSSVQVVDPVVHGARSSTPGTAHASVPPTGFSYLTLAPPARPPARVMVALGLFTIVLMLFGAEMGYLYSDAKADVWQGRAEIEYRGDSWTETQDLAIRSRTLTEPIAEEWDVEIKKFEERLRAGLVPGTQVLRIDYLDERQSVAIGVVTDVTTAYLELASVRPTAESTAAVAGQLAELEAELEVRTGELEVASAGIAPGEPLTVDILDLQSEINSLRSRIGLLELRLIDEQLNAIDEDASGVPRLITDPYVLDEPALPKPLRTAAVGAAIGLLAASIMWMIVWNLRRWRRATEHAP